MGLAFLLFVVLLVAGSLHRPEVPTYRPGLHADSGGPGAAAERTVTVDARDADRWVHFDLDRAEVVGEDGPWDLAFRRHEVRSRSGELDEALEGWYDYDFLAHLLTPRKRSYRVPIDGGGSVDLRFLSYYCPGPEAGCPTFRYAPSADP